MTFIEKKLIIFIQLLIKIYCFSRNSQEKNIFESNQLIKEQLKTLSIK
jgi:hypothetical protein